MYELAFWWHAYKLFWVSRLIEKLDITKTEKFEISYQ